MENQHGLLHALALSEAAAADSSMFGESNRGEGYKAGSRFRQAARARGFSDADIRAFSRTLSPGDAVCNAYSSYTMLGGNKDLLRMHGEFLVGFTDGCITG